MKPAFTPLSGARTQTYFKIGEAAKLLGLSAETLRRWERAGRIVFSRTPGGKRLFSEADIASIRGILKPTQKPTQTSTYQSPMASATHFENPKEGRKITISLNVPQFPQFNFNFKKISIVLVILLLIGGNLFFFSKTPYSQQAVLGAETFIAPAIEESAPTINSFLSEIGSFFKNNPVSSFVVTVLPKTIEQINTQKTVVQKINLPDNLKLTTLSSNDISSNSLDVQGEVKGSTLNITNDSTVGGNETVKGNSTVNGKSSIGGNLTLTGTLNGNTFNSTSLVFSGSSPSIYPTTAGSQISLNASGTGAINIGNSSTGDIYLGGGSTSGTYCLITNSNASLNCGGDITTGSNLHVNGGTLATGATTFNLLPDTATTINFGGGATTLSIGSSTGTTTVNNALTITGAATLSSALSVTGSSTLTGALTVNNNLILGSSSSNTIAFNGSLTTSIIPKTTGSVDLGSSSLKFNNLYTNTINTTATNTSGQAAFTQDPASTAITDASVLINPTSVTNNGSALLGLAVGGVEKARIDNNGNMTLQGNLTLSGTISNTSTTTSGDIYAFTDTSLSATGANLSNFTFKNNNGSGSSTVNGITVTEQAANSGGTNTSNLVNLSATANGTVNGIYIASATGFTNFFKTPTFNLDSSGNITGVVGLTASTLTGTLQTASQTNITAVGTLSSLTATGNVNSSGGSLQTNGVTRLDNSGNLTAGTGSFGGAVTPSLDASYDFGSATNRWNNIYAAGDVTAGDVVFKNEFRLRENGDKGINILNPKGEVIGGFDDKGNLWMKGEIKQGVPPSN